MDTKEAIARFYRTHPLAIRHKMARHHRELDLRAAQDALLCGIRVGAQDFLDLYRRCMVASLSKGASPDKFLNRPLKALMLARAFERVLARHPRVALVECGVFRGFSALLLASVARELLGGAFDGAGMYLVDSFAGMSAPVPDDAVVFIDEASGALRWMEEPPRIDDTSLERAQAAMREFPRATIIKGWIPEALAELPDREWTFVHLDVDMHEPTRACLEHFWTRLAPGGAIVCDDYVTPLYPGAMRAWDRFCEARALDFMILDTGQAVLEKR